MMFNRRMILGLHCRYSAVRKIIHSTQQIKYRHHRKIKIYVVAVNHCNYLRVRYAERSGYCELVLFVCVFVRANKLKKS